MKWFGSKNPGPCKGICVQYRAQKPVTGGRYEAGQSRCQICEIFISEEGLAPGKNDPMGEPVYCKCCGYRVRTLPRNKVYKEKYKEGILSKSKFFGFGKKDENSLTEEQIEEKNESPISKKQTEEKNNFNETITPIISKANIENYLDNKIIKDSTKSVYRSTLNSFLDLYLRKPTLGINQLKDEFFIGKTDGLKQQQNWIIRDYLNYIENKETIITEKQKTSSTIEQNYNESNQDVVVFHECPQCHKTTYRLSDGEKIFGTTPSRITPSNPYGLQSWCKACRSGNTASLFIEGEKTFQELHDFIESDIILRANYQLILLKYLIENGGGTKRDIAKELARQNNENNSEQEVIQKYLRVPAYKVLKDRGFIKEALGDSTYIMLNVTLSYDARSEILQILSQKITEYNNTHPINQNVSESLSNEYPEFYTILGPWSNWKRTIDNHPMKWGIQTNSPTLSEYQLLKPGDIVFYYVTQEEPSPFTKRGFFGIGQILRKYEQSEQFWPDEIEQDRIIYPYRFDFETIKIVEYDDDVLSWIEGLPYTKGLNHITNQEKLRQLLHNLKVKWGIEIKSRDEPTEGNYEEQLFDEEQKIKKNPKDETAWYQKARILSLLGRVEESLYSLIVVISIWPESKSEIESDDAFDNIRNSEMFKVIMQN